MEKVFSVSNVQFQSSAKLIVHISAPITVRLCPQASNMTWFSWWKMLSKIYSLYLILVIFWKQQISIGNYVLLEVKILHGNFWWAVPLNSIGPSNWAALVDVGVMLSSGLSEKVQRNEWRITLLNRGVWELLCKLLRYSIQFQMNFRRIHSSLI